MKTLHLAGCIIRDDHGKLLLLHRNTPKRVQWEIPGGKIEEGEDPAIAAAREVLEELGMVVEIAQEIGTENFAEDDFILKFTWFMATHTHGQPEIKEPHVHDAFDFFHLDTLGEMITELSPNAANFWRSLQSGKISLGSTDNPS